MRVSAAGRRDGPAGEPNVAGMTKNLTLLAAALTLVGVPAGLALTGGNVQTVMTTSLAVALAGFVLLTRRWPLAVLILVLLTVTAWRGSGLIASSWVWPATAAFVALVLDGRLRTAAVIGGVALAFGLSWDWTVEQHSADYGFAHIGGEAL